MLQCNIATPPPPHCQRDQRQGNTFAKTLDSHNFWLHWPLQDGERRISRQWGAGRAAAGYEGWGKPAEGGIRPAEGGQGEALHYPSEEELEEAAIHRQEDTQWGRRQIEADVFQQERPKFSRFPEMEDAIGIKDRYWSKLLFHIWYFQNTSVAPMAEILQALFKEVDINGDGYLTPDELIKLEASFNVTISQSEAEEIINRYDSNGDGRMDQDEFILYKQAKV